MAKYSKTPSFNPLVGVSPIRQLALPLLSQSTKIAEDCACIGTAIVIHENIAVTARHVIAGFFERHENRGPAGDPEPTFSVTAPMVAFDESKTAILWWVKKVYLDARTDLALLSLAAASPVPEGFVRKPATVDVIPPAIGERVAAFGYRKTQVDASHDKLEVRLDPRTSIGEVVEIHAERRDALLPFPCYQATAPFDGGMSGGPVFNDNGHLCGIICTSFDVAEGEHPISYVSTLWPLLAFAVDFPIENPPSSTYPFRTLFERSILNGTGWEESLIEATGPGEWGIRTPLKWAEGRRIDVGEGQGPPSDGPLVRENPNSK